MRHLDNSDCGVVGQVHGARQCSATVMLLVGIVRLQNAPPAAIMAIPSHSVVGLGDWTRGSWDGRGLGDHQTVLVCRPEGC